MKPSNQKNQIIVLCCLVAVVLGVGVFKVMGNKTAAVQEENPAAVEQSTQAAPEEVAEKENISASSPPAEAVSRETSYVARDPFEPQVIRESARASGATSSRQAPLISQAGKLPLPLVSALQMQPMDFSSSSQQPVEQDPTSTLRLTGVIEGDCSIAIIRGEGGTRYIVRQGQSIDGKYVVQSISRTGVRLRFGGKSYVLKLGSPVNRKSA